MNRVLLGVVAGSPPLAGAGANFLAIGYSASPYYTILDDNFSDIGGPAVARESYGFGCDPTRRNVSIAHVVTPNGSWLNLDSLTITGLPTSSSNPRCAFYCPITDQYLWISQNTPRARLFEASDFAYGGTVTAPSSNPTVGARSPNGSYAVVGQETGSPRLTLYDLSDFSSLSFSGSNPSSTVVSASSGNSYFSLCGGGNLYVYDWATRSDFGSYSTTGAVNCSAISADDGLLAVGTSSAVVGYCEVFNLSTGASVSTLSPAPSAEVAHVCFSLDGNFLAVAFDTYVSVYRTSDYTRVFGPLDITVSALALEFLQA